MNAQQIVDTPSADGSMPVQEKGRLSRSRISSGGAPQAKKNTAAKPGKRAKQLKPAKKSNSKSDQVLLLLRGKGGASIAGLQKQTGWQSHSARGFLSGTVKKKLDLELFSERTEKGERRYALGKA
jgi:hypothetical protein